MMINVLRFTRNEEHLEQTIELEDTGRLDGLISGVARCELSLDGTLNDKHHPVLTGHVKAQLNSACQVCLELVHYELEFEFTLHPVTEEQLQYLDDDQDPLVYDDEGLDLKDMVANELILSLPSVISHLNMANDDCSKNQKMTAGEAIKIEKASPFDVLKQLKS